MNHERDEQGGRQRSGLSPAVKKILAELERSAEALEPPPEETLARAHALPASEREEIAAVFGATARRFAVRQGDTMRAAVLAASAAEVVREARERERVAGRTADPSMKLGDALEILVR